MATCALSERDPGESPGKSSAYSPLSRRGILAGLAALPVIAVPAASAITGAATTGDDPMNMMTAIRPHASRAAWEAAEQAYRAADAKLDDFYERIWNPATDEINLLEKRRPDLTFSITAKSGNVAEYRIEPAELDEWAESFLYARHAAPIRDAYGKWLAELRAAERRLGWADIAQMEDNLGDAQSDAYDQLVATPAPDAAALAFKMRLIFERGRDDHDEQATLLADAERIAKAIQ